MAKEKPDAEKSAQEIAAEVQRNPEAQIQNKDGSKWGTREDLLLALLIQDTIHKAFPKAPDSDQLECADEIRQLRMVDGKTLAQAQALFEFACAHPFWSRRIVSPMALRKHWDRLEALAGGGKETWRDSVEGIQAKLEECGLERKDGELWDAVVARIDVAIAPKGTVH